MANNRICIACGKEYEYCGFCPKSLNLPVWKNIFDTENCKNIFEIASDYAQNMITKERAKERLLCCDLSNIDSFKEKVRDYSYEIMAEENFEQATEPTVKAIHRNGKKKAIAVNENDD